MRVGGNEIIVLLISLDERSADETMTVLEADVRPDNCATKTNGKDDFIYS